MRPTTPSPRTTPRRTFLRHSLASATALLGAGLPALARAASTPPTAIPSPSRSLSSRRLPTTLREKVGQLFMVSFQGLSPSPSFLSLLERYAFGGVILYAGNATTAAQVRGLTSELQRATPFPLFISTDQEGGRVVRIRQGVPVFPSEAAYGAIDSPARVYADAAATARGLRALGLTMNLAPVLDVLSNRKSPIGARSYGNNPQVASRLGVAAIQGYQQYGLSATAKHFVGLGHTSIDSHRALPTVTLTLDQLERNDLIPFRAAIAAGVSTVLVAHVALPAIDPVYRPASLSPVMIGDVLRGRLGFKGLVMTDSLLMGAVPHGQEPEAAERAFAAGADILLIGGNEHVPAGLFEVATERVLSAVQSGRIPESRLDASVARILALKARYPANV